MVFLTIILAIGFLLWRRGAQRDVCDLEWIGEGAALPLALLRVQRLRDNRGRIRSLRVD